MKRFLLFASVVALGSGCVVAVDDDDDDGGYVCDEPGTVTVYWSFQRHTQSGLVTYDCYDAGVAEVALWIDGRVEYTGSCGGLNGAEGISIVDYPYGTYHDATLVGYDSAGNELFQADDMVYTEECNYLVAPALVSDMAMDVLFRNADESVFSSCAPAGVDTVSYQLYDLAGTLVISAEVDCSEPLVIENLDFGEYTFAPIQGVDGFGYSAFQQCELPISFFGVGTPGSVTLDETLPGDDCL